MLLNVLYMKQLLMAATLLVCAFAILACGCAHRTQKAVAETGESKVDAAVAMDEPAQVERVEPEIAGAWTPIRLSQEEVSFGADGGKATVSCLNYDRWWLNDAQVAGTETFFHATPGANNTYETLKAEGISARIVNNNQVEITVAPASKSNTWILHLQSGDAFTSITVKQTATMKAERITNETLETIAIRTSVRSFTDQKVTDAQMEAMLRAAMAAPSGSNIQPWSFVVLTDKSKYEEMFKGNFNLRIFKSAPALVVFCADTTVTRAPRNNPDAAPVTRPNGTWRDDMGACTENFLVAAASLGLGTVWTASYPYPDRYLPIKEALGLPATVVPYCVVAVGYPDKEVKPKDKWKPERIHKDRW